MKRELWEQPPEHRTPEICLAAVKEDGWNLLWVPNQQVTQELCLAAVRQVGGSLLWVSPELLTPEICLAAVRVQVSCAL